MIEFETDDFLYRSVVVHPRQSKELSLNTCKVRTVQKYFYNKGVQFGMNEKYDKYEVGNTITDFHCNVMWSNKFHTNVETTAFQQGYDAINNLLKKFKDNRAKRKWGKKVSGKNHGWADIFKTIKPNEWTDINDIFRHSKDAECTAIAVNGQHPSLRKGKWRTLYMNLPGIGNVELLTSIKNLPEQIIHTRDKNENRGFYQTNIVAYQLVENTKKITSHTSDASRTFEIHLTLKIPKPEKTDRTTVIGSDRGIVHQVVTYDGLVFDYWDTPGDCKRHKNDDISKQQKKRDRHRLHSRRWKKEHRKLKKMLKILKNKRLNNDRHMAKNMVMKAGAIAQEDLSIVDGMITKSGGQNTGLNRELHSAGLGMTGKRITQTAENHGVTNLRVVPHYTSITCSKCNRINNNSRITRDLFKCVYCGFTCEADANASANIRHYSMPCIRRLPLIINGRYKCESINDIILANDPTTDNSGGDVISGGRGDRHETGESGSGLHLDGPTKYGDNHAVEDPIIEHGDNQAVEGSSDCQEKPSSQQCNRSI